MRTIAILAAAAVLSMVVEPREARASGGTSPASHFASPLRQETTTEYRIFEADQVFREAPASLLGKPIVTVGIASGSRLDLRVGPACRSLTRMGFAFAGRF
jgi:hypothetical protein